MKKLMTYVRREETRKTAIYFLTGTVISLAFTLLIFTLQMIFFNDPIKPGMFATVPFMLMLFVFAVSTTDRIYRFQMQMNVSRKSGLKVLYSYCLIVLVVFSVLSLALEFLYSFIFSFTDFNYTVITFSNVMRFTDGINTAGDVLIAFGVNILVFAVLLLYGMFFPVMGNFFSPRVTALIGFGVYIGTMMCISFFDEQVKSLKNFLVDTFGVTGAWAVTLCFFELLAIVFCTFMYLKVNYKEKQLAV